MLKLKQLFICFVLIFFCIESRADEGMWLINSINAALEKKMHERGLKLDAGEIYNADAEGASLSDAVVSLDFGCTGSIISDEGLLITNHHCAYSDVHSISSEQKNYLEDGFYAALREEEVHIKGKGAWFLKKVYDVTEEVDSLRNALKAEGKPYGSRRLTAMMERKYRRDGLEAYLYSMWSGAKCYMALYKVYKDVRLVVAPPVCVAAYGAEVDNWEWPQHKCDFAMYRVYTAPDGSAAEYSPENIPLIPEKRLKISVNGYNKGDYAMVLGYPGRTNRYSSAAELILDQNVMLPAANRLRGEQMKIISKWMNADPKVRLLYSDYFFGLSNVQELFSGQVECVDRFHVVDSKKKDEEVLSAWIEEYMPEEKELLDKLYATYASVAEVHRNTNYFRETLVRGTRLVRIINRLHTMRGDVEKKLCIRTRHGDDLGDVEAQNKCFNEYYFRAVDFPDVISTLEDEYAGIDLRVESELFKYAVCEYFTNVDTRFLGQYQKQLISEFGSDKAAYEAIAEHIWNHSLVSDKTVLWNFLNSEHTLSEYSSDPMLRFFKDVSIVSFNEAAVAAQGEERLSDLNKRYTHAMYAMKVHQSEPQYPDANSSMRITYGTIGDLYARDAVCCNYFTTVRGIMEKYDPDVYDFSLKDGLPELYASNSKMPVNFICDCDITGGNSGSPVLNAYGELIGLAFDGNKESLASDVYYTPSYNKCVCVDIRFVLWILDNYMNAQRILEEIYR